MSSEAGDAPARGTEEAPSQSPPPPPPPPPAPTAAAPKKARSPARHRGHAQKEVAIGDWVGTKAVIERKDPLTDTTQEIFLRWDSWRNTVTGEVSLPVGSREPVVPQAVEEALSKPRPRRNRGCKDYFWLLCGYGFLLYTLGTYVLQVVGGLWAENWVEGEAWTELLNTARWTRESYVFLAVACVLYAMALGAYTKAVLTPPGHLPLRFQADRPVNLTEDDFQRKICVPCNSYKPARTHHCSVCNVCVRRFDHHCPWIGQCVGFHNHKVFLVTVFYVLILVVYFLATAWPCVYYIIEAGSANPRHVRIPGYRNLYVAWCLAFLYGMFITWLVTRHVRFTSLNVTDIESRTGEYHWSLGSTQDNCGALCGRGPLLSKILPCQPKYEHDGTSYVPSAKLAASFSSGGKGAKGKKEVKNYGATGETAPLVTPQDVETGAPAQ